MTRHQLHAAGVAYVARQLRRRGVRVTTHSRTDAVALTANGLAISVRVSRIRLAPHRVTVAGRRYCYRYPIAHFNLHAHGRRIEPAPDVWVLVVAETGPRMRAYVVPERRMLRGKTVTVLQTATVRRRGHRRLGEYEGRWDVLTGRRAEGKAA